MEEEIRNYLRVLQSIAICKGGDMFAPTIPALNAKRTDTHEKLFEKILQILTIPDGVSESDIFLRTKEILSRLDKVFRIYNEFDLDIEDNHHVFLLSQDLERFLSSSEVKNYLECRCLYLRNIVEP